MIKIISDSSVCLTQEEARFLDVQIIPTNYSVGEEYFLEHFADTNGGLDNIKKGTSTSATKEPGIEVFKSAFSDTLSDGDEVLCFCISSKLSRTYYSANEAAKQLDHSRIKVVDTHAVGGAIKLLVKYAIKQIALNKTLDEVFTLVKKERKNVGVVFSVDSLGPLKKSGRLGLVRQAVSAILNIRPIIQLDDGSLKSTATTRGKNKKLDKLVDTLPQNITNVIVHHVGNPDCAIDLSERVSKKFNHIKTSISLLGPVLAIHLGIPAIGLAWQHDGSLIINNT